MTLVQVLRGFARGVKDADPTFRLLPCALQVSGDSGAATATAWSYAHANVVAVDSSPPALPAPVRPTQCPALDSNFPAQCLA